MHIIQDSLVFNIPSKPFDYAFPKLKDILNEYSL